MAHHAENSSSAGSDQGTAAEGKSPTSLGAVRFNDAIHSNDAQRNDVAVAPAAANAKRNNIAVTSAAANAGDYASDLALASSDGFFAELLQLEALTSNSAKAASGRLSPNQQFDAGILDAEQKATAALAKAKVLALEKMDEKVAGKVC